MLYLFNELKQQINFKKNHETIESWVFQSMKLSMVATLLATILVTAKTYIGENINCVTGFSGQERKAIETYCFISSTFTLVNFTEGANPYPGVGPINGAEDDSMQRHAYYQWVPMVLTIQTFVLYFPKWLWKEVLDKSKFTTVLHTLHLLKIDNYARNDDIRVSASYMAASLNTHTPYALQFLLCELVAFCVGLGNLFFTNAFLGGSFFKYGQTALSYITSDVTNIDNPLNVVFPKIAKCIWRKFGPSGSIQTYDAMCVLPLNIVNEKTYIMLWLVYIISFTVLCIVLLLHIVLLFAGRSRNMTITRKFKNDETKSKFNDFTHKLNYGDWFFINHLSGRMIPAYFDRWIVQLVEEVDK